jgi:peptidoglycan/xylan/chitin deacetylase (PgdA/CDA1 family)
VKPCVVNKLAPGRRGPDVGVALSPRHASGFPLTQGKRWHAGSVRRREFFAAAAGSLIVVGCGRHRLADASPPPAAGAAGAPATAAATRAGSASSVGPAAGGATRGSAAEILQRSTVPALCYHQVREYSAADSGGARSLICPPAVLERHLRALSEAGMQPVTSTQLVDHLEWGAPLPPRPVMISFDDASAGHFSAALPILQRLEIPATFFIMTVVLDKPGWLSRDQVRRLDHAGMTIGVHTWDHHRVTTYTGPDWARQLERPKAELEDLVGHRLEMFAYPYGAWNSAVLPHVQQAGYRAAFQLTDQPPDPQQPLLTIRRVLTSSGWDTDALLARLRA